MTYNFDKYTKQEILNAIQELDYFWSKSFNIAERLNNRLLYNRTQTELARNSQLVDEESKALRTYLDCVAKQPSNGDADFKLCRELYQKWQQAQKRYQASEQIVNELILAGGTNPDMEVAK